MLLVPSAREQFPMLQYGDTSEKAKDRWNLKGKSLLLRHFQRYFQGIVLADNKLNTRNWKLSPRSCSNDLRTYAGGPAGNYSNYSVARVQFSDRAIEVDARNQAQMEKALRNADAATNFALLVLATKNTEAYANFKNLCDRFYGIQSICVTQTALEGNRGQLMGNLMLKLNLKTAGSNHSAAGAMLQDTMKNTLVLGADVTHPGKGSIAGCPSIAAIVGSVDNRGGRFLGSMRLQSQDNKEVCTCSHLSSHEQNH